MTNIFVFIVLLGYFAITIHADFHDNFNATKLIGKPDGHETKPRFMDTMLANSLIRNTLNGAAHLMNPCELFDSVKDGLQKPLQKSKARYGSAAKFISRELIVDTVLPALRDGINLVRSLFVLQETSNLTVFLDQNKDSMYDATVLQNYSQYYVRAGNNEMVQILFIGLVSQKDLAKRGNEVPALEFLANLGLVNHPRQYTEYESIPNEEANLINDKREQMSELLSKQDTFWQDDVEYISNVMTVGFNGPETDDEYTVMLPRLSKIFQHKMATYNPLLADRYEDVCEPATNNPMDRIIVL